MQRICRMRLYPLAAQFVIIALSLACIAFQAIAEDASQPPLKKVTIVCVDPKATLYGTFQSHNQKVLSNRHGIFVTHIRSRNQKFSAQAWRLSRSTDGGRSFATIYQATHATNPPVIETDEEGNIFLMRVDYLNGNAYLYRFRADRNFENPAVMTIPKGSGGKYAMTYDPTRKALYFLAYGNFFVIGLDGRVRHSEKLVQPGPHAGLEYPLLNVSADGALHAAWTTQKHGVYLYRDIHHMLSPDGGMSWKNLDRTSLSPPIVADETGPAMRITLDDEFSAHTWLSNFVVKDGKVHFVYLAQTSPPRQHYMRYDIATGERDVHLQPEFKGETITLSGLDGFFASRSDRPGSPLYCVMQDQGHIACLVSDDNGLTWHDYAKSEEKFRAYAIGGSREITDDGYIIGSFTDTSKENTATHTGSKVYFFKIKAKGPPPASTGQKELP